MAAGDDDAAGEDTTSSGQDSPSSSPTKQLNKLKRFLKTIHHLGSDISVEIGDLVRSLVLKLVVSDSFAIFVTYFVTAISAGF